MLMVAPVGPCSEDGGASEPAVGSLAWVPAP
jgi:hypothetical protein